jgi:hypothetical protein
MRQPEPQFYPRVEQEAGAPAATAAPAARVRPRAGDTRAHPPRPRKAAVRACDLREVWSYFATLNGAAASVFSQAMASLPPSRVTSQKKIVSCSMLTCRLVSTAIGTRRTSLSGV